jgi:DNA-binding NtrC family response regulator
VIGSLQRQLGVAAPALPHHADLRASRKNAKRAVLFVDQVHLQRSLARELGRLEFDVILPITLNEFRQALQRVAYHPDLVVMDLRNAEGGALDLLEVIPEARIATTSLVLVAEAAEIDTVRHRISLDGIEVLPTESRSFSRSVGRLCGAAMPDV